MLCPSPKIPKIALHEGRGRTRRSPRVEAELGFVMDHVESVQNLSSSGVNSRLLYFPDPIVYNFTEENHVKKFKGEVLIFEVRSNCSD